MFSKNLKDKIKEIKKSIVAIGYNINETQVTIIGSGFALSDDGNILTCAHVYNQVPKEFIKNLKALVIIKEEMGYLDHYSWIPVSLVAKDDQKDVAVLKLERYKDTLLNKLELGDSDSVDVGQDVYFIGFPYAAQLANEGFGITLNLSRAVISSIKRDGMDPSHYRNWIFVDSINNPGNSGAPLIDVETNKVVGFMAVAFRTPSQNAKYKDLDIREPMHIGAARPINFLKELIR
ncbi:MAG: trypsin-like peptidase domain-containing protein [Candidatus Doudnabacteria bacterium]|nr:trypsin-like peptidase domain-containing protein [Candidatus Doudnabacteria bacterium]